MSEKVPKGWKRVKLENSPVLIIDGDRGRNYPKKDDFLQNGYCLFLNTKNVTLQGFDFSECKFISKEKDEILRKGKLERNDVVLTTRGTVGNVAFYNGKVPFENIRINSGMVIIRPNGIYPDFNYQLFRYLKFKFGEFTSGSAQSQLPIRDLKQLVILLPPFQEQRAIASVLSSLDDKIDLLHRQNKTLEKMAETLFRQWFIEEAKEDWEEKKLEEVCFIRNGYAFKSETYQKRGQKIIRTLNFKNGFVDTEKIVYISEELAKSFNKYFLNRKDFLLVMVGANIGNYAVVTKDILPALQNQNMWCFKALQPDFQFYLNYYLKQIIKEKKNIVSGSAREFFQKKVFANFTIPVPENIKLRKFNKIVEDIFSKIENNRIQIRTLEKLRDTLLPKLMSGEVRVKI